MKLYNDATSPFGRKVLVAALERSITLAEEFVDIYAPGAVDRFNALRQIPTLVLDDTRALFDSDVIMGFLDTLHDGVPLVPPHERWERLSRASLANGLMEAVLLRVMEQRRAQGESSPGFIRKMEDRVWRVLAQLDSSLPAAQSEPLFADEITIACALEYVDFRFSADWRGRFPKTAGWLAEISVRPSMVLTGPMRTRALSPVKRDG